MALADALDTAVASQTKGPTCTLCVTVNKLSDADKAALDAALESELTHAVIARALQSEGHNVKTGTVARHRRFECATREPV
jgi:hypothetical protein